MPSSHRKPKDYFAYVGCRTTKERNARGKGINVYRMNGISGEWSHVQLLEGVTNPSFIALGKAERFLYCVHGDGDQISAFAMDPAAGTLSFVNRQKSGGTNPVYVAVDPSGRFVLVANYGTGSVASLPIAADGSLATVARVLPLPGSPGPHRMEQTGSHPHAVSFDREGSFIVVPDKGLDRIFVLELNNDDGTLTLSADRTVTTRAMAGPRHIAFHPSSPYAYVANELDSTVTAYQYDSVEGKLQPLERISTTPPEFTSNNTAAEIAVHPSGRYLYCSNRGHNSIATFAIRHEGASISPVDWQGTQGKVPRFFALDPSASFLYAANEESDTIVPFRIEGDGRILKRLDHAILTGSPVCIVFKESHS